MRVYVWVYICARTRILFAITFLISLHCTERETFDEINIICRAFSGNEVVKVNLRQTLTAACCHGQFYLDTECIEYEGNVCGISCTFSVYIPRRKLNKSEISLFYIF